MLSVDPEDDFRTSCKYRASSKKQSGEEEHDCNGSGRSTLSHNGICADSGNVYDSGQSASRNSGRHGNHKKSKSDLYRKSMPIASPEADDEDDDYHCARNSNKNHRILQKQKYYQKHFKPTVGLTPSRIQWDYRKGVS
jgi:hypothetical protein